MARRRLNVDLAEVVQAMDQTDREFSEWYLDTQTGEVLLVHEEVTSLLEEVDDDKPGGNGDDADVEEECEETPEHPVPEENLAEWQREERELAAKVADDKEGRYVRIPEVESLRVFGLMRRFAADVRDRSLREKLDLAFEGGASFRRFKHVLYEYPQARREWLTYADQHKLQWAREWLESLDIETTWEAPAGG